MSKHFSNTNPSPFANSFSDASSASSKNKRKPKTKIKKEPNNQLVIPVPSSPAPKKKHLKQEKITDAFIVRKKVDRFKGMPEEEVIKRTLPDHLALNLDILIIGINPGLFAAFKGHHYAGPGNHFWKCLYLSGLIPEIMTADDDYKLIEFGIGFTNIVSRTTKGSADLNKKEIKEGAKILLEKIQRYKPKIAVFNGKGIYEVFSGSKKFDFGKQPDPVEGTTSLIYVMPSSSARCAQLPRAVDKVPFYVALKKLRDHLCGRLPVLHDSEVCFPDIKLKIENDGLEQDDILGDGDKLGSQHGVDLSANIHSTNGYDQSALSPTQSNFHMHQLGRAALAAAAAAGKYLDEKLINAGLARSGESLDNSRNGSVTRKYKSKKVKVKTELENGSDVINLAKQVKIEVNDNHENYVKMENPHHNSDDCHQLQSQGELCPPPTPCPNPQDSYGAFDLSLYQNPHLHIKQEKIDLLDSVQVTSSSSVATSSFRSSYFTSVGCLYEPSNLINGGYGLPQSNCSGASGGNPYTSHHPVAQQGCFTPSETVTLGVAPNFDSTSSIYANLENVKVKQEKIDSSYGEY